MYTPPKFQTDRSNALAAGFAHHFVKPIDAGRLMAVLEAP